MRSLSLAQLKVLGCLSRKAYGHLAGMGVVRVGYEEWRHSYTAQICDGLDSWRMLDQRHYIPLCNAYRAILGKAPRADNTPKDEAAALIWTIRDRARHWELPLAYIAAIVADKTGRNWINGSMSLDHILAGLDATTLRHILYTLQARGRTRAQKDSNRLGLDPPNEIHTSRSTMPPARLAAWRGDLMAAPLPTRPNSSDTLGFYQ